MKSGDLYKQPTAEPTRKVLLGVGGGGGITALLIWLAGLTGLDMPPEVAGELGALIGALVAFVSAYFIRESWVPPESVSK